MGLLPYTTRGPGSDGTQRKNHGSANKRPARKNHGRAARGPRVPSQESGQLPQTNKNKGPREQETQREASGRPKRDTARKKARGVLGSPPGVLGPPPLRNLKRADRRPATTDPSPYTPPAPQKAGAEAAARKAPVPQNRWAALPGRLSTASPLAPSGFLLLSRGERLGGSRRGGGGAEPSGPGLF